MLGEGKESRKLIPTKVFRDHGLKCSLEGRGCPRKVPKPRGEHSPGKAPMTGLFLGRKLSTWREGHREVCHYPWIPRSSAPCCLSDFILFHLSFPPTVLNPMGFISIGGAHQALAHLGPLSAVLLSGRLPSPPPCSLQGELLCDTKGQLCYPCHCTLCLLAAFSHTW